VAVRPDAAALEPPLVGAADHVVVAAAAAQQPGQQVGPAHGPLPLPPAGPLGLRPLPGRQVDDGVVVLRPAANPFRLRHLPLAPVAGAQLALPSMTPTNFPFWRRFHASRPT